MDMLHISSNNDTAKSIDLTIQIIICCLAPMADFVLQSGIGIGHLTKASAFPVIA
jgi:hypothetical protein